MPGLRRLAELDRRRWWLRSIAIAALVVAAVAVVFHDLTRPGDGEMGGFTVSGKRTVHLGVVRPSSGWVREGD